MSLGMGIFLIFWAMVIIIVAFFAGCLYGHGVKPRPQHPVINLGGWQPIKGVGAPANPPDQGSGVKAPLQGGSDET